MKQRLVVLTASAILAVSTVAAHGQAAQQPAPQDQPPPQYQQQPQTQYQQPPQQAAQTQYQQQCPPVYEGPPINPEGPMVNIGKRHGNLRQAQGFLVESFEAIQQAQSANDYQLGGHAQRAKDLITQAAEELRMAANVSNREGR
jgi:hypothetical protein